MKLLGEFYDLKSELLESKENIIKDIEGWSIEEKTTNIINWFMFHDISNEPKTSNLFWFKKRSYEAEERQKSILVASTRAQEEEHMQKLLLAELRCKWGMELIENKTIPLSPRKKRLIISFGIRKGTK